jgi:hypothetical protein
MEYVSSQRLLPEPLLKSRWNLPITAHSSSASRPRVRRRDVAICALPRRGHLRVAATYLLARRRNARAGQRHGGGCAGQTARMLRVERTG